MKIIYILKINILFIFIINLLYSQNNLENILEKYKNKVGIKEIKTLVQKNINSVLEKDVYWFEKKMFEKGDSSLIIASTMGYTDIAKALIENGADVNYANSLKNTALMRACSLGNIDIVKYLIEKNADVNSKNKIGYSALMNASYNGHADIVKILIEHNAYVNERSNEGYSALILAASGAQKEVVKMLLENNADIKAENKRGLTAFDYAKNHPFGEDTIKLLKKYGNK